MRIVFMLVLLCLGACGKDADGQTGGTDSSSELTIAVSSGAEGEPVTWTLTCDPPGGTHPDPAAACAAVDAAPDPFAPVPADMVCTQVYGGPETATITGTWRGQRVDASFKRTDGCEIARWGQLAAVFGAASTQQRSGGA